MKMNTQVCEASGFPSNRKHSVLSRVSCLFCACCPLAVFFAIWAIIVLALDFHSIRTGSHVSDEILNVVPSGANGYAASSIARVPGGIRVCASLHHSVPNTPNRVAIRAHAKAVFFTDTPTGNNFTAGQIAFSGSFFFSAIAPAQEHYGFAPIWVFMEMRLLDDFKFAKSLTDDINFNRHSVAFFNTLFSSGEPARTGPHCEFNICAEGVKS